MISAPAEQLRKKKFLAPLDPKEGRNVAPAAPTPSDGALDLIVRSAPFMRTM
jgi:hypothetical protein